MYDTNDKESPIDLIDLVSKDRNVDYTVHPVPVANKGNTLLIKLLASVMAQVLRYSLKNKEIEPIRTSKPNEGLICTVVHEQVVLSNASHRFRQRFTRRAVRQATTDGGIYRASIACFLISTSSTLRSARFNTTPPKHFHQIHQHAILHCRPRPFGPRLIRSSPHHSCLRLQQSAGDVLHGGRYHAP